MVLEELVARLAFTVEGLEKLRRAAQMFQRLQRAIAAFALAIARRLGRVAVILARVTGRLAKFGASFIARSALVTAAATAAQAALMKLAAGFAKARQESINQAFVNGVDPRQMALVENLMVRVGAGAKDAQKWVGEFAQKVREGIKEGGDWADALAKQGVRLKDAKGKAKSYSQVIDDVLRAADKIKDADKRRDFLKEGLEGAPDDLIANLLQATSAFGKWQKLIQESRKAGGNLSGGDILNASDITEALGRIGVALKGFTDAIGSGLMAAFSTEFRKLGEAVMSVATDENRDRLRSFAGSIGEFLVDVRKGGFVVLSKVADALKAIVGAVSEVNEATGGRLEQIGIGLTALAAAFGVLAAGPAVTAAATITGLLWAVAKFQEWKSGGNNALSEFFDTIRDAVSGVSAAIDTLLDKLRAIPGFGGLSQPTAPDSAKEAGRKAGEAIRDLFGKEGLNLQRLEQKRSEMSPPVQTQKMAADRDASSDNRKYENIGNDQRSISVTNNLQVADPSGVAAAAAKGVLGAISTKGANTSTGALTAP